MLPEPFENFISALRRIKPSPAFTALINKMNEYMDLWKKDAIELKYFNNIERCPAQFLNELGAKIAVSLDNQDTEQTKRKKILSAVAGYKKTGSWTQDVKPKIDAITGYSAGLYGGQYGDDAIFLAKEASDPDAYWMTWQGKDGTDDELGILWIGDFTEQEIAGIIYIDCHETIHVSTLTNDEVARLVTYLKANAAPAYYRIFLGYTDVEGIFVKYPTGQIY